MGSGAAEILLQCVFDGSISMHDTEIQRRPYHKDCKCALHKLKGICPVACSQHRIISFPKKQEWTDCSLSIVASKFSSHTSSWTAYQSFQTEDHVKSLSSRR